MSRTRVALQRFAALAAALVLVGAVPWLAMLAVAGPAELEGVTAAELAAATTQLAPFGACSGALGFAVGAATARKAPALGSQRRRGGPRLPRQRRLPAVKGLEWTRDLSPWHWYLGGEPLKHGLQVGGSLLLLAVTVGLVAAGTWRFNRRDVAV